MTVNRSYQVCNIYVDNVLKASFMTDKLGGMTGNNFYLGNMVWQEEGANPNQKHYQNAFTGYIDELCLFQQALPTTLIKRYSRKSPRGNERGLVTYMGFNRQERTKQNDLELFPYALNQVITTDEDGVEHLSTDSVFVKPVEEIVRHIDRTIGAPVQPFQELKNLNFSFVGKDNQLLVNIDELDKKINKCTVHVTVTEIPDKNGNYMASPATESFFVNRNPLRWKTGNFVERAYYGRQNYMIVYIVNTSGAEHTYTIEGLPRWMSVNSRTNVIDPQDTQEVYFVISDEVNVGVYDEVIYLVDENGLAEPMKLEMIVEDDAPEWYVPTETKRYSMNIVGQVFIGDAIVTNSDDVVAAFDAKGHCMGKAHVDYNTETGLSLVNLPVATALAEYWSFAKDGDIIKSRDAFAQFYEGSDGATAWMGSLKYMKPGEGYMLLLPR